LILGLTLTAWLLYDRVGEFRSQEEALRDLQTQARAAFGNGRDPWNVAVVRITDADYDSLFQARSPLDAETLQALIGDIAKGGPRLIAVDIDTSDSSFRALRIPEHPPIVWVRSAEYLCRCESRGGCDVALPITEAVRKRYRYCAAGEKGGFVPLNFRGGRNEGLSGVAALKHDEDAVVRRYSRAVAMAEDTLRSFAWSVARLVDRSLVRDSPDFSTEELFIHYEPMSGDAEFTASEIRRFARDNPGFDALKGKIVLLGGFYWAARDTYFSPLGRLPGVDIHAQVVETELQKQWTHPASGLWVVALLIASSIGILLVFHYYRFNQAFWRAVGLILLFALAGSLLATRSPFVLLPYFIPVLGVVLIQQMRESAQDLGKDWLVGSGRKVLDRYYLGRRAPRPSDESRKLGPEMERILWARLKSALVRGRARLSAWGLPKHWVTRRTSRKELGADEGTPAGPVHGHAPVSPPGNESPECQASPPTPPPASRT
jgi:CHASE2 domain-containing sensor protein